MKKYFYCWLSIIYFLRNICKENKHISYSETVLRNKLMLRADKVVKNFE